MRKEGKKGKSSGDFSHVLETTVQLVSENGFQSSWLRMLASKTTDATVTTARGLPGNWAGRERMEQTKKKIQGISRRLDKK